MTCTPASVPSALAPGSDGLPFTGSALEGLPTLPLGLDLGALRLDDFAGAGLVLEVRSELLADTVVFASDDARIAEGETRVVYRAAELRELRRLGPEQLRFVHELKRALRRRDTEITIEGVEVSGSEEVTSLELTRPRAAAGAERILELSD